MAQLPNGRPAPELNRDENRNIRVTNGSSNGAKIDPNDPKVRKLVYNMYRGMLGQRHHQANEIINLAPKEKVEIDVGVGARVESMMRQEAQLTRGGMNTTGTLPPPPPPPIPSVLPSSRLPTEIPARPSPVMNPPAVLAGAMMKDKKPFTYTPGGIDLSEINSPQPNAVEHGDPHAPVQSRSFRVLQTVLSSQDSPEPQGSIHIPSLLQQQKPGGPQQYQPPGQFQHHATPYQHSGEMTSFAPTEDVPPEPKKYMGGSIPSRSFKMLQAMTNTDDVTDQGVAANGSSESSQHPHSPLDSNTQHAGSHIPSSPSWKLMHTSPPSLTPSSTQTNIGDSSSDSGIFSSKVSPSYTTTEDSKVYRNVTPKVTINNSKHEHVVNSALSKNSASSPTWKNTHTPKFFSSTHATPVMKKPYESNGQDQDQDSPRLMKIVRQESSSSQNSQEGTERRYEGAHIPSRVFRQLQTEYSDSSTDTQDLKHQRNSHDIKPQVNSNVHPPHFLVKGVPSRVVKSMQSSDLDLDQPNSTGYNQDDYYSKGMQRTAAHKDTVLKELTSQFDHMGTRKKPRAAPGRVFRHLQMQYDTPDQDEHQEPLSEQPEDVQGFGHRGCNLPSPSFRSLQNQYQHPECHEEARYVQEYSEDALEYEHEPLPYQGARIPGRTFKSLQDNVGAHPSVLKPKK